MQHLQFLFADFLTADLLLSSVQCVLFLSEPHVTILDDLHTNKPERETVTRI